MPVLNNIAILHLKTPETLSDETEPSLISMDGKGRWIDNVYVERFWRSLKVEEINLHAYATPDQARERIADYIRYFNEERPHQGLDNRPPDDVYYSRKPLPEAA